MLARDITACGGASVRARALRGAAGLYGRAEKKVVAPVAVSVIHGRLCSTKCRVTSIQVESGANSRGAQRVERQEPPMWREQLEGIYAMHGSDDVGTFVDSTGLPEHLLRFHVLIGGLLSSQTKEHVNAAALQRLIECGLTVQEMLDIDEEDLAQIIRPVSFYNNKAKHIKKIAAILKEQARGADVIDIPDTYEGLLALPGIGPKIATLVMTLAWNNTVGICVDTHVHRVSNRLGWVDTWNKANPKSQDPEKTRAELEAWLPFELWGPINRRLVLFGQSVCLPRTPKCGECGIKRLCQSSNSSSFKSM